LLLNELFEPTVAPSATLPEPKTLFPPFDYFKEPTFINNKKKIFNTNQDLCFGTSYRYGKLSLSGRYFPNNSFAFRY